MREEFCPLILVDDEEDILFSLQTLFRSAGFRQVSTAQDSRKVPELLEGTSSAVVVLDLNMPMLSGFDLLKQIVRHHPQVQVIIVTAASELDLAVECMKEGAVDYIVKPVERSRLLSSVRRAMEKLALTHQVSELKRHLLDDQLKNENAFASIVTRNPRMRATFHYLEAVAGTGQPVLISGPTGVGKELFARALHDISGRKGEFVPLNVAGLDDNAFSDTLFGHIRGAFTGADAKREGFVARAAGGTLFLDEIGDLAESSQVKLLRLIQEGEYYPLGADRPRRCEARVVVATHRDLRQQSSSGRFRQDLYYRLNVHHVEIPPLAERADDIPLLLEHLLEEAACAMEKPVPTPPPELARYLATYAFPGNVRELKAMVYDAVARHRRGVLSMSTFLEKMGDVSPSPLTVDGAGSDPFMLKNPGRIPTLREAEAYLVAKAMELADGNQGIAASYLGITRQGLNKKLNRHK